MRSIEPIQHYLVSHDIESVQLTNNADLENNQNGQNNQTLAKHKTTNNISQSNLIVVQIVDKILFLLFFILIIALHN